MARARPVVPGRARRAPGRPPTALTARRARSWRTRAAAGAGVLVTVAAVGHPRPAGAVPLAEDPDLPVAELATTVTGHRVVGPDGPGAGDTTRFGFVHVTVGATRVCFAVQVPAGPASLPVALHRGRPGRNGPIVARVAPADSTRPRCTDLAAGTVSALVTDPGAFYVTVATDGHPAGAWRGNLAESGREGDLYAGSLRAPPAGADAPPVTGTATATYDGRRFCFTTVLAGARGARAVELRNRWDGTVIARLATPAPAGDSGACVELATVADARTWAVAVVFDGGVARAPLQRAAWVPPDLDPLFGDRGYAALRPADPRKPEAASALALDAVGRIALATSLPDAGPVLARFTPNGRLDRSFGGDGETPLPVAPSTVRAVAGGYVVLGRRPGAPVAAVRVDGTGRLDGAYGDGGVVVPPDRSAAAIAGDGSLYALVPASEGQPRGLARWRPDGTRDSAFVGTGIAPHPRLTGGGAQITATPRGLVAHTHDGATGRLVRWLPDGRPDLGFGESGAVDGLTAGWLSSAPDGSLIVVAGPGPGSDLGATPGPDGRATMVDPTGDVVRHGPIHPTCCAWENEVTGEWGAVNGLVSPAVTDRQGRVLYAADQGIVRLGDDLSSGGPGSRFTRLAPAGIRAVAVTAGGRILAYDSAITSLIALRA